jgi:CBS domain-containing protein
MRCQEIMKQTVQCVSPEDSVQTAATRMREANVGFLPVCDESSKVLGTITDRDLALRIVADERPMSTRVSDVMTQEIVACRPEDDVTKAEDMMGKNQKSRIMCIDARGRLMGVISLSDLAQRQQDGARTAYTLRRVTAREARPQVRPT